MRLAKDPSVEAKRFIDKSLKGREKPPSKAAYARAVKMARAAIVELTLLAGRTQS